MPTSPFGVQVRSPVVLALELFVKCNHRVINIFFLCVLICIERILVELFNGFNFSVNMALDIQIILAMNLNIVV